MASAPAIIGWDQAYNRNGDAQLPRAVVNVIRTYVDNDTLTGWVKAETLAEATGLQVRGVRKQIAANVKAGWLVVVESGNSSGKANTYRLTYPKGVLQDTVAQVDDPQRVSHRTPLTPQGCPTGPVKGVLQDTPTTPRTSPQREVLLSSRGEDPFADEGERVRYQPVAAGQSRPDEYNPGVDTDMSPRAQRFRAHTPFWEKDD